MALPGVSTVIKDRFYSLSRTNIPSGPRIAIIGRRTINDGDSNTDGTETYANRAAEITDLDPYNPANEQNVIEIFGYGSDLHRGYVEAIAGGAQRITLVAMPKDTTFTHASGTVESSVYTALVGSNTLFDDAFEACESVLADIIVPWGRGAGLTEFQSPATPGDDAEFGFYANNTTVNATSWLSQIANKCATITANSHPCFAVIGIKPFIGIATANGGMTPASVSGHLNTAGLSDTIIPRADNTLDNAGVYTCVVAAELRPVGYNLASTLGYSNGAAMYAGAITQLDPQSSPTGKIVYNVESVRYNPTRSQQQAMIDVGVVPVALDFERRPRWVDAQTYSKLASDYTRLTTLRIVFNSVQMIRQVTQKFIGEAANLQARNAIDTAITSGLRTMQQNGSLISSDFTVRYVPVDNEAIIDLVIRPAFELRNIEVSVSVQL